MSRALTPDICIIGGGAAGVATALAAAAAGASTVLIEKSRLGGAHLHAGGVASHALAAAAGRAAAIGDAERFGIAVGRPKIELIQVREHLHHAVAKAAPDYAAERLRGLGIHVIEHAGGFTSADTLSVDDQPIKAGTFVIATGSVPMVPAINGLAEAGFLTYDNLFDLTALPRQLVILGADAHDLPVAQSYRRLGASVTVIAHGTLLPDHDPECVDVIRQAFAREGIALYENAAVRSIERAKGRVTLDLGGEIIEAAQILVAGARRAATEGLGLQVAKASQSDDSLAVDANLKTGNSRIYAIGDAAGARTVAEARGQALRVVHAIKGLPDAPDAPGVVPTMVHNDPPLAHVGLTEAQARARRIGVAILRSPFGTNDRAVAAGRDAGQIKVVVAPTGRILGVTIVGPRADDLIAPWTLALANGLDISAMAALATPYPGFGDTSVAAATGFAALGLTPSRLKRIIERIRR